MRQKQSKGLETQNLIRDAKNKAASIPLAELRYRKAKTDNNQE